MNVKRETINSEQQYLLSLKILLSIDDILRHYFQEEPLHFHRNSSMELHLPDEEVESVERRDDASEMTNKLKENKENVLRKCGLGAGKGGFGICHLEFGHSNGGGELRFLCLNAPFIKITHFRVHISRPCSRPPLWRCRLEQRYCTRSAATPQETTPAALPMHSPSPAKPMW